VDRPPLGEWARGAVRRNSQKSGARKLLTALRKEVGSITFHSIFTPLRTEEVKEYWKLLNSLGLVFITVGAMFFIFNCHPSSQAGRQRNRLNNRKPSSNPGPEGNRMAILCLRQVQNGQGDPPTIVVRYRSSFLFSGIRSAGRLTCHSPVADRRICRRMSIHNPS
jgi:hypothetical protein